MKYQIMNFFSGKQQTYNTQAGKWRISNDRWDDVFEATPEVAKKIYSEVLDNFRKVNHVTRPKLHIVE